MKKIIFLLMLCFPLAYGVQANNLQSDDDGTSSYNTMDFENLKTQKLLTHLLEVGIQYVDPKHGANAIQYQMSLSIPVWKKYNPLKMMVFSGIDYTGGSSPVAGINFKPLKINSYISEFWMKGKPLSIMIGADAGYLVNHRHGKNGLVLTPHLRVDYRWMFVDSGWDFNVTGKRDQFYVRVGFSVGLGVLGIMTGGGH